MSVLIDMPMPQNCRDCMFKRYRKAPLGNLVECLFGKGLLFVSWGDGDDDSYLTERLINCPLKEV